MSGIKDCSLEQAFAHDDMQNPVMPSMGCFPCRNFKANLLDLKGPVCFQKSRPPAEAHETKNTCWGCGGFRLIVSRKKSKKQRIEIFVQEDDQGSRKTAKQGLNQGYSRPPIWKRAYRKLKAETKQVHVACCEGICWPTEVVHYNTLSYEKNFDKGREFWSPYSSAYREASSGSLWQEDSDMSEISLTSSSPHRNAFYSDDTFIWQRKRPNPPSELHA